MPKAKTFILIPTQENEKERVFVPTQITIGLKLLTYWRYPARAQGTKIGGDIIFSHWSKNMWAHI